MTGVVAKQADPVRTVAVCVAKDCRTSDGHRRLVEELDAVPCRLVASRCLDVCSGPVVVVGVGERKPRVFRKVRRRKQRRDLRALIAGGSVTDRLRALRVTGSSGRRAVARVRLR